MWNIQKKQWPPWATSLFKGHVVHLRLWQDERLKVIGRPSPSLSATVSLNKCKHVRKQKQQSPGLSSVEILESWLIAFLLLCCLCKKDRRRNFYLPFVIISITQCHGFAVPNDISFITMMAVVRRIWLSLSVFSLMLSKVKMNFSQKETRTKHFFKERFILREFEKCKMSNQLICS